MTTTKIAAFDSTLQTTNIWLNEIDEQLGWQDKHRAYHALRTVLHALRDLLPVDVAVALGTQLPMLIRGFYYEGWHAHVKAVRERKKDALVHYIAAAFHDDPAVDPEEVARAVFQVIARHVTAGEIKHVKLTLPRELQELWSEETRTLWF